MTAASAIFFRTPNNSATGPPPGDFRATCSRGGGASIFYGGTTTKSRVAVVPRHRSQPPRTLCSTTLVSSSSPPLAVMPTVQPPSSVVSIPATSQIPHGVGLPPPPGMDPRKGKLMCIKVRMLDDTTAVFHLGHKAIGQALFDEVCRHLNLLESDYFGLEFIDGYGNRVWLDKEKSILRQITATHSDARFFFIVKFYTPTPADLEEEYTRYLMSLQIRRDLAQGEFVCNENTAALMVAYIVQADCGDFATEDYPDHTYLSPITFVPNQTVSFQIKVMQNHKQLVGMTPGEADLALLEIARRCDFYGIKLHIAKDIEGTDVNLSVAHCGIRVFHNLQCVSVFSWAKIRKLSFKRKRLMIKLHPESNPYYKETVEFTFDTRNECKNFWKKCVEHHAFFRCTEINESSKKEHRLFSRGSSFRYHGRTQKQLIDYVREHHKRREPFSRQIRPASVTSNPPSQHVTAVIDGTRIAPFDATTGRQPGETQGNGAVRSQAEVYYPSRKPRPRSTHPQVTDADSIVEDRNCVSDVEGPVSSRNPPTKPFAIVQSSGEDPMSVSLPNVLGDDIKIICREFELNSTPAGNPKSASGDFLEQVSNPNAPMEYFLDNTSEGSYKLHDDHASSSSDIGATPTDPRVLSTTFTTKRIGNVVVKRVNKRRSPSEDEDSDRDRRARYAAVCRQSMAAGGMARFRDSVPVPIDGPNAIIQPATPATIIRPVVLSRDSPPVTTRSATIQQIPSVTGEGNYALVHRVRQPPPAQSTFTPSSVAESASGGFRSIATTAPPRQESEEDSGRGTPATYGATGPLRGKVIHSDNIVVTPEGITVREAILSKKDKREKPVIPPKPKNIPPPPVRNDDEAPKRTPPPVAAKPTTPLQPPQPALQPQSVPQKSAEPASESQLASKSELTPSNNYNNNNPVEITPVNLDKMLEPLDSILKDAASMSVVSKGKQPQAIEIEDEDTPDVKKLHLLNGNIPYTLTMRTLDSGGTSMSSTSMTTTGAGTGSSHAMSTFAPGSSPASVEVSRRGIDLVQRRRLPSQDSFSSQDHSISPTNPDTGNVMDYVLRRRSVSSDRGGGVGRPKASQLSSASKRNDPRRKTQPATVRFDSPVVSGTCGGTPTTTTSTTVAPVAQAESSDVADEELPAPPVELATSPTSNDETSSADVSQASSQAHTTNRSGLLWTDF